uniref:RING-CH-type domain-containing protein n=1 Tax=Acrobeloides nanus TaxID=290746 RepID=A0A914CJ94_9BILA
MDEEQTSDLISPCDCRGSLAFIHHRCLDQWYAVRGNDKCDTCQYKYEKEWCGIKPISEWWKFPPLRPVNLGIDQDEIVDLNIPPMLFDLMLRLLFESLLYANFLRYFKEDLLLGLSLRIMMAFDSIIIFFALFEAFIVIVIVLRLILNSVVYLYIWIDSLMVYRWKNKSALDSTK